ncbi:MAG: nucleotide exchange factor GrpE [Defluviitaleaceae bacterium]|nr:nucleotide exchange factor GrpE [Defluviitaleaceae bacterium]
MAKQKTKRSNSQKLYPAWREYNRARGKRAKKISEAVGALIAADTVGFSRVGDSDEAAYTHLIALMDVYRRVIDLTNKKSPESETVRVMIAGICEVLGARLHGFEENACDDVNPISAEKQAIIQDAEKKAAEQITARESIDELFAIYRDGLTDCQQRVDDLHNRKVARLYTELIEREWEELGNIITVQVAALKGTGARDAVIFSIADALGEAYQQTEPIVKNLHKPKKSTASRTLEEFASELPDEKIPDGKKFFAALDTQSIAILDEIELGYKKAAYKFRRDIADEVLLAKEITQTFEQLQLPQGEASSSPCLEILSGISETLEIKTTSLNESIAEFEIKGAQSSKNFSDKKPIYDREEILLQVRDAWLANPPKENGVSEFFEGCEAVASCRNSSKKYIEAYAHTIEKSSLRFKKEVLLYEVCTFEEILTHSVPRLRESADAGGGQNACDGDILTAVLALNDTFRALAVILKKNNIEIIRPDAKTQFNAREHEVLVAEKNADFQKGEIIKVMTAGYRFKDQVVLRANVIAAR